MTPIGPLFWYELQRLPRRRLHLWRVLYAGALLLGLVVVYLRTFPGLPPLEALANPGELDRAGNAAFAETFLMAFLAVQQIAVIVLTPLYAAGSIADEKERRTFDFLLSSPLPHYQILLGKLLPCLVVSLFQGFFLLFAGKLVFGMSWGPEPWLLLPVVTCTSVAAVGLAMLVASVSRTETQVAVYGTLLVLVLGGVSGSLMPRDLMPESMKQASLATPHAWALDAYSQLLVNPQPEVQVVATACLALLGFGAAFLAIAWWRLDLE